VNGHQQLLDLAVTAAERGAAHVRTAERPAEPAGWDLKGAADYVTSVDRDTEQLIAEILLQGEPDSDVLGEELTPEATRSGLYWVVDPLDGTTNYLHRYPAYGVSIAAVVDGALVVGVVVDIPRGRTYRARSNGGAWCGDEQLRVSQVHDPTHALIGTGFPFKVPDLLPDYLRQLDALLRATAGVRRAGAASLDLVDLAVGRFDGFWELYLAPWDVAAGAVIVREAGGRITDLDGRDDIVRHGAFVAGNPAIHAWLLEILRA
jgi:myo-inositol-1(or 4)-monophosphatase